MPDPQSEQSASNRQHHAFGEQLRSDLPAGCAHRQAHGHFSPPAGGAGQQEIGEIRTSNQEHEQRGDLQHEQASAGVSRIFFLNRDNDGAQFRVGFRILFLQVRGHALHVLLCLLGGDAGLQPRDDGQKVSLAASPLLRRESHGHPVVAIFAVAEKEILRHHADHSCLDSVQQDQPPEDRLVTAKAPAPQVVTQHHHRILRLVLFHGKWTSHDRLHAQNIEEVWRHLFARELFRLPVPGQAGGHKPRRGHIHENAVLRFPVQIICGRRSVIGETEVGHVLPDDHQAVRLGVGKGPQQNRFYRAENGGVSADSERQGGDRQRKKARILRDLPEGIAEICEEAHDQ